VTENVVGENRPLFLPRSSSAPHSRRNSAAAFDAEGAVACDGHSAADVTELYVAGNVRCGLQLVIMVAAEGT
jgi:hypothetical protein